MTSASTRFRQAPLRGRAAAAIGLAALVLLCGPVAHPDADSLARHVTIRRDTFGVPHLLADSEAAAAFGLGYAQAEDHPTELIARMLRARGEAARVFGVGDLDGDLAMARFDNARLAREALAHDVGRGYRRVLEAYAAGVNHYVRQHRAELPAWVVEVSAADVLANSRSGAVQAAASNEIPNALRRKYPPAAGADAQAALTLTVAGATATAAGATAVAVDTLGAAGRVAAVAAVNSVDAPGITDAAVPIDAADSAHESTAIDTGAAARAAARLRGASAADIEELREADGSNALALAGSRTVSGRPMLLGNPHLRWQSLYWEAHITVPGRINFYGSTLIGIPTLRAGFNEHLGYVQTNNDPDLEDVFALPIDPSGPDRYRVNGRSRTLTRRDVSVAVRQPDGSLTTERRTYWDSHLGPIVYRSATHLFALRSEALRAWRYFEGFQALMPSRSLADFQARLARSLVPTSNFTYADAAGHILYQWNARLPRRVADGTSYELDVPGDSSRFVWTATHPLADLPRLLDPPGGAIQNANNSPWYTSLRDRLDPARYPAAIERHPLALRPQRVLQMLEAREKFSVEDLRALKFDTHVLLADRVLPDLLAAVAADPAPSADAAQAASRLAAWNRRADADSTAAPLFFLFWDLYRAALPASAKDDAPQPFATPWSEQAPGSTPSGLADRRAAVQALEQAMRMLRIRHGSDSRAWGAINRFRFGDLDLPGDGGDGLYGLYHVQRFDPVPGLPGLRIAGRVPSSGEGEGESESANASAAPPSGAAPGVAPGAVPGAGAAAGATATRVRETPSAIGAPLAGFGDAWVLLVHFTQPVQAQAVLAYGQTTRPDSPHSRDQIRLFASHQLRRVIFTEAEIQANLERSYRP